MSTFFTIFGASGDLAKLKIYPALFTLIEKEKLSDDFHIVGYARSTLSDDDFFDIFATSVRSHMKNWGDREERILLTLKNRIHYISAPYDTSEGFEKYRDFIGGLSEESKISRRSQEQSSVEMTENPDFRKEKLSHTQLLYLAVPPAVVSPILSHFSRAFPDRNSRDIRVILEKPFGHDEASARALLSELRAYYDDSELYFLDHYMGKKSMRSLLALRAKNRIIDTMIEPSQIDRIEISALEDFDIRDRVGYFDSVGIIRDMVQSHLFEMLALIALDLPPSLDPMTIAAARARLLDLLRFLPERDRISIGQYASYQKDHEVTKNSNTETFVALSLRIDDEKWCDVPIFLRSGKSLERKETYIVITFRPSDHAGEHEEPNRIIISLYPEEEISMRFLDESGDRRETHEIITRDSIRGRDETYLGSHELLFLDAIEHERRFFLTPEEILASWRCVDRVFSYLEEQDIQPEIYPNKSSGPKGQYEVLREWYKLER